MEKDNKLHFIAGKFSAMTPGNMEYWYNRKLNRYFLRKSSTVQKGESDDDKFFIAKFDAEGNIINATFNRRTKQGFPIGEKDFVQSELSFIEKNFDWNTLKLEQRKILEAYKELLLKRNSKKINLYPEIFVNAGASFLFSDWHEKFKNDSTPLASYSFLFNAMNEDNLLISKGQQPFLDFLSSLPNPIHLDRIKSNPAERNRKPLYNSLKEKYFKEAQ